jgi:hypothetical protein
MDATEAPDFTLVDSKGLASLPYDTDGQAFVAFERPEGLVSIGKFVNTLKFIVKEVSSSLLYSFVCSLCIFCMAKENDMLLRLSLESHRSVFLLLSRIILIRTS